MNYPSDSVGLQSKQSSSKSGGKPSSNSSSKEETAGTGTGNSVTTPTKSFLKPFKSFKKKSENKDLDNNILVPRRPSLVVIQSPEADMESGLEHIRSDAADELRMLFGHFFFVSSA